jgi:oligopeptide transport system substrate-binding protein
MPELRILGSLFEGLVRRGSKPGDVKPGVAETWEASPDGRKYTFRLRPCRWSDGKPLTSGDFIYAWRRFVDPATASEYGSLLKIVRNGERVRQKLVPPESLGVSAPDAATFEVELEHPAAFFLDLCAFEPFAPAPRQAIEKHGTQWTEPGNLVGNGPFVLEKWDRNVAIRVKRSSNYWDAANTALPAVIFKAVDDQLTAYNMFLAKEADWLFSLPPSKVDAAKEIPGFFTDSAASAAMRIDGCVAISRTSSAPV